MLPAYIIEELRRREDARREESARPRLELPIPTRQRKSEPPAHPERGSERGVAIIEVWG